MTLVYKKVAWEHPLISCDKPVFLAVDANSNKILVHQKFQPKSDAKTISLPLVCILYTKNQSTLSDCQVLDTLCFFL